MIDRLTVQAYDTYSREYDTGVIDFWEQFPSDFPEQFASQLPGNRVLDVGSGSGRDAVLLRNLGLEVICVDASPSMIDITSGLGFESHQADFGELDFPEASFDGAWAYTSLIHVPKEEAQQAIRGLRRFIKPAGRLAIGVIEGDTAGMVEHVMMPGAARYFKKYDSQELKEMVEPLGFSLRYENKYQPHDSIYLNQLYEVA